MSSAKQKDDLERQVQNVQTYLSAQGKPFEIITDVGSGLNYNKKGLKDLIDKIEQNKVEKIVVLYKDRLLRYGFEIIEYIAKLHTFDGLHRWISVGIELPNNAPNNNTNIKSGIGIDLGVKELAVLSNGQVFHNINKSERIKKLKRKERRLQRSVSRKFKSNNLELTKLNNTLKKGKRYKKTRNITKLQKQLLKLTRRIHNILQEHIRKVIVETAAIKSTETYKQLST